MYQISLQITSKSILLRLVSLLKQTQIYLLGKKTSSHSLANLFPSYMVCPPPPELPNDLRLNISGNQDISGKCIWNDSLVPSLPAKMKILFVVLQLSCESAKVYLVPAFLIFLKRSKFGIKRLSSLFQDVTQKDKINSSLHMTIFNYQSC